MPIMAYCLLLLAATPTRAGRILQDSNYAGSAVPSTSMPTSEKEKVGVAVVGGGISGAYTAWRMQNALSELPENTTVKMFERTARIGGRFYSPTVGCHQGPQAGRPRAELGGMRIRSTDNLMNGVVAELGIPTGPFLMNGRDGWGNDDANNPVFLRGWQGSRAKAERANTDAENDYDQLGAIYQNSLDSEAHQDAFNAPPRRVVSTASATPHRCGIRPVAEEDYDPCSPSNAALLEADCGGQAVYKWSTGGFQERYLNISDEGQDFRQDVGGYHLEVHFTNFASQMGEATGDFVPEKGTSSFHYTRPLEGMQSLPRRLHQAFEDAGGTTQVNMQLMSVTVLPQASSERTKFLLRFKPTFTHPCNEVTSVLEDEDDVVVYADRLVLAGWDPDSVRALPIFALDEDSAMPLQHPVRKDIEAVTSMVYAPGILQKWFFAFDKSELPAYTPPGATEPFHVGRYTTSTAPQQVFQWYPGTQQAKASMQCSDVQVLQMYTMDPVWVQMANERSQFNCPADVEEDQCGECPGADLFYGNAAHHVSKKAVSFFRRHLSIMLNVSLDQIPEPLEARYMVWDDQNPQTQASAVHTWLPGARFWEGFEAALQPHAGLPLHIVGEAMALNQGWGEGALETAEYMLQEKLGLSAPAWLTRDDYCRLMPFYPSARKNSA